MSGSSPSDLAVAFRSIERRLREALEPISGESATASQVSDLQVELRGAIRAAARLMHCDATSSSVAATIEARHGDSWIDSELDELRGLALSAGQILRQISVAAEAAADR